ncbi:hypothetical protein GCM10025880_37360 [Methylorubrum aminovorans]|nr:hypothetical protein GCM10025880_37360 [Methylorubrum aminovorans]
MDDESVGASRDYRAGHGVEGLLDILIVDAEAAFHRDGYGDGRLHGRDAGADQVRLAHQAGAEASLLHPVGRAADIEVDLGVTEIGGDPRRRREIPGSEPPSCTATGCSPASKPSSRSRSPCSTAPVVTISV